MKGKFFGIGIGPGDPELLTIKALRLIKNTRIICVPKASKEKDSIALQIIAPYLTSEQQIVELVMPMTKDAVELQAYWQEAGSVILDYLHQGQDVVCLTLGDASLYSTYLYLQKHITAADPEIVVETIPGISSFSAAAARLNLALAEGNENLCVLPAVEDVSSLNDILNRFANVVLMKVAGQFEEILDTLEDRGIVQQAVLVSRCGQGEEKIEHDLATLRGQKQDYLSLILIKQGERR